MRDLRVASGKFKGAKLTSPNSVETHPMGAREKLALFNMVDVRGKNVLDAFAGSGALGIEALSRGADVVTFVESSSRAEKIIRDNLTSLMARDDEVLNVAKISLQKVAEFSQNEELYEAFDVIFADPPYEQIEIAEIQSLVNLLTKGGTLVVSSPASEPAPDLAGAEMTSSRTYAGARLSIYNVYTT